MLRLTTTLVAALYAAFAIWGEPGTPAADATPSVALATTASASQYPTPVILDESDRLDIAVTRDAVTDDPLRIVVPDAASIAAAAPDPATTRTAPRPIGEPVRVSLIEAPRRLDRPMAAPAYDGPRMVVTGTRVNLRAGPSTAYSVVDSLPRGTMVEPMGDPSSGWIELRTLETGVTGYMSARFLDPA